MYPAGFSYGLQKLSPKPAPKLSHLSKLVAFPQQQSIPEFLANSSPSRVLNPITQRVIITSCVTILAMSIQSFRCPKTETLFNLDRVAQFAPIERVALRKLAQLDVANELKDLRTPPGNRLEALIGDRLGQHSVRINDQWRICFIWTIAGPTAVEIVDYHD